MGSLLRFSWSVVSESMGWLLRHRRWSLWWAFAIASMVFLGSRSLTWEFTGIALLPAFACGVWTTWLPGSYVRAVSGPYRRWLTRRWARRNWPSIARACGLSVQTTVRTGLGAQLIGGEGAAKEKRAWIDPPLVRVLTDAGSLTLRVQTRRGQSVDDITAVSAKLRDAVGAHSLRCLPHAPSVLNLVFTLHDPLLGTRLSSPDRGTEPMTATSNHGSGLVGRAVLLGRGEDGSDVVLDPVDPWHIAAQGETRSGKSALSYTLLGGLAFRPDVLVCGVDPSGILLAPWQDGRGGSWIATGTADMARAVDVLAGIVAEMDRRIARLLADGQDKLDAFDPACPLLLVVMEEYPGALSAARSQDDAEGRSGSDRLTPRIERGFGRLVKEGAKVGIRLIVLAQRMSAKAVDTDDRSNFGLRITLRVDNADAVMMLHDGPTARAYVEQARQFPAGMGLVEGPGRPLQRWRADFTDYATYRAEVAAGIEATDHPGAFTAPTRVAKATTGGGDPGDPSGETDETLDLSKAPSAASGWSGAARKPRKPRAPRAPRDTVDDTGDAA